MSLSLYILQNKSFFKKELNIKDLIQEDYEWGFRDEYNRLRQERRTYGTLVIYHPEHVGTGVTIPWPSSRKEEITLNLSFPTTRYDIELLYELLKRVCEKWNTPSFEQNEQEYSIEEIEELKEMALLNNKNHLAWNQGEEVEENVVFIQGAMWPLYLNKETIENLAFHEDEEGFASILHDLQIKDLYYAAPKTYRFMGGKRACLYAATATIDSIFPYEPKEPELNNPYEEVDEPCSIFAVSFVSLEKNKILGSISYEDFLKSIDAQHLEKFDEKHFILPGLSEEEMQDMVSRLEDPMVLKEEVIE